MGPCVPLMMLLLLLPMRPPAFLNAASIPAAMRLDSPWQARRR